MKTAIICILEHITCFIHIKGSKQAIKIALYTFRRTENKWKLFLLNNIYMLFKFIIFLLQPIWLIKKTYVLQITKHSKKQYKTGSIPRPFDQNGWSVKSLIIFIWMLYIFFAFIIFLRLNTNYTKRHIYMNANSYVIRKFQSYQESQKFEWKFKAFRIVFFLKILQIIILILFRY